MRCPSCNQDINTTPDGECPLCSFPVGEVNRKVTTIYVITSAIFFSTLIYALIVYLLSTTQTIQPTPAANTIFWLAIVISVVSGVAMLVVNNIIVKAALCEAPAILGLCVFFMSGDIAKFVALLGISLVMFMILAPNVTAFAKQIQHEALEQWQQREHEGHTW